MMRRPAPTVTLRRARTGGISTLLLLALFGCAVGPDYQRPATPLPERYATGEATPATAPVAIDKAWWTHFQDDTLNALVAQALANNHDLLAAVARLEEAEAVAREAGATFYPEVDLAASSSRTQYSERTAIPLSATTPRLRDSRKGALNTSFELDLWGKLRRANEAARAQLLASGYARDTVELSIASAVTTAYLDLRALDASLSLTGSTLESRRKALEIANSRLQGGTVSPLDVHQAQGTLAAAQAQQADLRRQRALAESLLGQLTAQPQLRLEAGDLRQIPLPPTPPAGLPSSLLEARPDIRQAEETLVSANAQIGVAKAALFPSLSLTGSLGSESAALTDLFTAGAGTWSLGLAAAMPLFDAGRNSARIDQASARQKQSLIAYQSTIHTAFKEVSDALVTLRESASGERAQQTRVEAAQKTLEISRQRYQAGYSAFLDVLDAERSANDAQLAWVAARQARLTAAVSLFKALGGGWQDGFAAEAAR